MADGMEAGSPIRGKIRRMRELRFESERDDVFALSDDLSSEQDFKGLCLELAEEAVEREMQADAIAARIKDLSERKARLLRSADTLRDLVLQCMESRGEPAIQSPTLTLRASRLKPDVVITDESALPSRFFVTPPPKLDKAALKAAVLDDGEVIDGATLGNGKITLVIRRK